MSKHITVRLWKKENKNMSRSERSFSGNFSCMPPKKEILPKLLYIGMNNMKERNLCHCKEKEA